MFSIAKVPAALVGLSLLAPALSELTIAGQGVASSTGYEGKAGGRVTPSFLLTDAIQPIRIPGANESNWKVSLPRASSSSLIDSGATGLVIRTVSDPVKTSALVELTNKEVTKQKKEAEVRLTNGEASIVGMICMLVASRSYFRAGNLPAARLFASSITALAAYGYSCLMTSLPYVVCASMAVGTFFACYRINKFAIRRSVGE